jgi:hypothetical protein
MNYWVRKRVMKLETMLAALQVGYRSTSWLCRLQHKSVSHLKEDWAVPNPTEASINRAYKKRQLQHCTPYSLQYGVNLELFSHSIDPLRQWHALRSIVRSELFTCAHAENLVRASEQVSSLAAEISTQLQGAGPASWLDIFRPCCSVAASNFGQVMRLCIFPTYSTLTPTTRGTTVKAFKSSTSDSLHIPIVFDTGASLSLTPFLDDFDNTPDKSELKELQAVSSATKVEGIGTICWKVIDLYGAVHILKTKAYFVPTAHIWLYSPHAHFRESSKGSLDLNLETLTLRFPKKVKLVFPINQANQLLLMFLDDHQGPQVGFSSKDSKLTVYTYLQV